MRRRPRPAQPAERGRLLLSIGGENLAPRYGPFRETAYAIQGALTSSHITPSSIVAWVRLPAWAWMQM